MLRLRVQPHSFCRVLQFGSWQNCFWRMWMCGRAHNTLVLTLFKKTEIRKNQYLSWNWLYFTAIWLLGLTLVTLQSALPSALTFAKVGIHFWVMSSIYEGALALVSYWGPRKVPDRFLRCTTKMTITISAMLHQRRGRWFWTWDLWLQIGSMPRKGGCSRD